jgi:predicted NAD/FAD-dependent oxidoreductase
MSATAVGESANLSDDALDVAARSEIAAMARAGGARLGGDDVARMTRVAVSRVPYAQYAQPPGARTHQPTLVCGVRGLWRASETFHSSSLEGAARGGAAAAHAILAADSVSC